MMINRIKAVLCILVGWVGVVSFAQATFADYLPTSTTGTLIQHQYYTLSYAPAHRQAEWVSYQVRVGSAKRKNHFRIDPLVREGAASLADYRRSGYDRGHLAPAASMACDAIAMSESFYLSNMSPQMPRFNRGIWQVLEAQVRTWAKTYNPLYVVSAPVLSEDLPAIGVNRVSVPAFYYKVVYAPKEQRVIAFLLPNGAGKQPLADYVVTVDALEALTGIDFLSQLDDVLEMRLEASASCVGWPFAKPKRTHTPDRSIP